MTDLTTPSGADFPSLPQTRPRVAVPRRRFATLRSVAALVLREMSTTNGRSPGGYLWAIMEPVAGIALLSAIFSMGFRTPAIGSNFALFYATGLVPLTFFTTISGRVGQAVLYSRQLLAYPSVTFVDAILARFLLNSMTKILVATVIFSGIFLLFDTRTIVDLPVVAAALALAAVLGLAVGTLNCFLVTKFPVWQQIWSIVTRPLFLISCVLMLFDHMPAWARDVLWYNPIVHIVGLTRHGFYPTYRAAYVSVTYVLAVSLVTGSLGLLLLFRYQYTLLER